MLERLTLENVQAHRRLDLDLDPAVTCLVGPSGAGKTAVLRGLRWLASNRPAAESLRRHGAAAVAVTAVVDGREVARVRDAGHNAYLLDGKEYLAVGQAVPAEVASLLNLDPAVNFQGQFDAPYWFLETPGEVSRELNAVVNLTLIDRTLGALGAEVRSAAAEVEVAERRLGEARDRRDSLLWADAACADLEGLLALEGELAETRRESSGIASLLAEVAEAEDTLRDAAEANVACATALSALGSAANELRRVRDELTKLTQLHTDLMNAEEAACRARGVAEELGRRLGEASRGRCPLCGHAASSP